MLPQTIDRLKELLQTTDINEYFLNLVREKSKLRHSNYEATVNHSKEMAVHAWGEKPVDILNKTRPREDEAVKNYRLESWEPITLSKFDKAISILQKIFNPRLFSISFPPQPGGVKLAENETLEYYTRKNYPLFDDIFNFCSEVLLKQMIADPNGVIAVTPSLWDLPQTEFQVPHCVLFNSNQVLNREEGQFYILQDSKTFKYDGREGKIIHVFTKTAIYTYYEIWDNSENVFRLNNYYEHNFGTVPVWHLGGVTDSRTYPFYYKSFFYPALPYWNKAIRLESDLDGAYVNHLHPQKWEMTLDCEYQDKEGNMCNGGRIFLASKNHHYDCPKCHATGKVSVKSPYDVYQISNDKLASLDGKSNNMPPAGYITVPTDIINVLKLTVAEKIDSGLEAINMDIVNKIGENQSGIAKVLDRSELHSFMSKIADYIFDNHIPNIFYYINRYRYGVILGNRVDEYLPIISKPTTFDDLTIQELTEEIAQAKQSNSNSAYIVALEKDAALKRFSTNEEIKNEAVLTIDLDPFPNKSVDEKFTMINDGSVSKSEVIISNNIVDFIKRALEEVKDFAILPRVKQKETLKKYADEVSNVGKLDITGMLEPQLGLDTPVDVEADAKAKLKGSVGGVQGILEIQKQVSEGITTYNAGLAILELIYGIEGEAGRRILGDEAKITKDIVAKKALQVNDTRPAFQ